jgi:hypothetical protein
MLRPVAESLLGIFRNRHEQQQENSYDADTGHWIITSVAS